MQKFLLKGGDPLLGREALADTMEDIIVDSTGALAASLFGYLSLKFRRGWVHNYLSEEEK